MKKNVGKYLLSVTGLLLICVVAHTASPKIANKFMIEDFANLNSKNLRVNDSKAQVVNYKDGKALKFTLGHSKAWPSMSISGKWDLSNYNYIKADLINPGKESIKVGCRVDNQGATGRKNNSGGKITIAPGETRTLTVRFNRQSPNKFKELLKGMHFYPDGTSYGATLDPAKIISIQFFGFRPARDQTLIVDNIRATGIFDKVAFETAVPKPFMPFVDELGQYRHRDWPGKTHSTADLINQRNREIKELKAHPEPADLDKFGGWTKGPKLKATGHFRTEQYQGKWWFVDPMGRLFWSFGPTCVRNGNATFVELRDNWFEKLPPTTGDVQSKFYSTGTSVRGDYKGKKLKTFDFGRANLLRKYGKAWQEHSFSLANRRLRSWGMNTMACWSKGKVIDQPQTPYATWIYYNSPKIRAWGITTKPFPDFFDPRFEQFLERRAKKQGIQRNKDPYCIGFFIDNELSWGTASTVGRSVLKAPKNQPAKQALIAMLKKKYSTIKALNKVWKTDYKAWNALESKIKAPAGAKADLEDYCRLTAEKYFSTCQRIMRKYAPDKLYLGCRFAEVNPVVTEVANKYCDVVSFNLYRQTVAAWQPPTKLTKPVVIGEFHFGAPDRGVFGPGLVPVNNQEERATALKQYVNSALNNPLIIGAHWFQYRDETMSGRPLDGENHQVGLVDICDTPYALTIAAIREVGYKMYKTRIND